MRAVGARYFRCCVPRNCGTLEVWGLVRHQRRSPCRACLLAAMLLVAIAVHAPAQNAEPPLDRLLAQVKKGKNRSAAIARIAQLKPDVAVPALIGLFAMPSEEVRLHAAMALGGIGKPAVGALQKSLGDSDERVRFYAVWALALTGPTAKPATPALVAALRDEDEDVRYKAAYALGQVAADSDDAIAALVRALKDTDADVVAEVRAALTKCGLRGVAALRKALAQREIAYHAAHALSQLAHAKDDATARAAILAVPDVLAQLRSAKTAEDEALAGVLPAFGPTALPALRAAIKDASPRLRCGVVNAIGEIGLQSWITGDGEGARQAIKLLISLMPDADLDLRLIALMRLANIASPEAGPARRAIETALTDDWFEFSRVAYEALQDPFDRSKDADDGFDKRIAAAKGDDQLRLACLLPRRHRALLVKNLAIAIPTCAYAVRAA